MQIACLAIDSTVGALVGNTTSTSAIFGALIRIGSVSTYRSHERVTFWPS